MKKIKNSVVSVLLFSFLFLAVHDFAMLKIDSSNHYVTSSTSVHLVDSSSSKVNLVDDIHKSIHTLIAIDSEEILLSQYILTTFKPSPVICAPISNYNTVLERPPLS